MGREGVGAPRGIEEDQRFVTFPPGHVGELIAAAIGQLPGIELVALGRPHPAHLGHDDRDGLGGQALFLGEGPRFLGRDQGRPAVIAIALRRLRQLLTQERTQSPGGPKGFPKIVLLGQEGLLLSLDANLLQTR